MWKYNFTLRWYYYFVFGSSGYQPPTQKSIVRCTIKTPIICRITILPKVFDHICILIGWFPHVIKNHNVLTFAFHNNHFVRLFPWKINSIGIQSLDPLPDPRSYLWHICICCLTYLFLPHSNSPLLVELDGQGTIKVLGWPHCSKGLFPQWRPFL
jgi:hypothetical protein